MRSLLSFQTFDHYLVYWIAPTVGAVLATVLFAVFQASFLDDGKKNKADSVWCAKE
jgi:glycerol uptake facilitator-like aquaporin